MVRKRFYIVWLLGLALFVNSCGGNSAPPDAVITSVTADETLTIGGSAGFNLIKGPIQFKVTGSAADLTPVADVAVTLTGSPPEFGNINNGFVTNGLGGTFVNPVNPNSISLLTDQAGVVTVYYQFSVPACVVGGADQDVTANVSATIGASATFWKDDITVSAC